MSTIQSNVEYLTNRIISNDRINVKNNTIEEIKPKPKPIPIEGLVLPKLDPEPVISNYKSTEEPIKVDTNLKKEKKYEEDLNKPESPYTKNQEYAGNDSEKEYIQPILQSNPKEIVEETLNPGPYENTFTDEVQPQLYEQEQPLQYDGSSTDYIQPNIDEYGQPIQDYVSQPQQEYDPSLYDPQYQEQYEGQVDQQYDPNAAYDYDQQQYNQPQVQYQDQYQTEQYADDPNLTQNYDPTLQSEQMQPLEYSNQPLDQYQEPYDQNVDPYSVQQDPIENYESSGISKPNLIPETEYLNQTAQPVQNIDTAVNLKNT